MTDIIPDKVLRHREENRRHYAKHRERYNEKHIRYNKEHKEQISEWAKEYHRKNADKRRQYSKEYQANNKEKRRELYRKRRARLNGVVGGHFTDSEWKDLLDETGHKCLCCGATDRQLCRDHVIPLGPPHSDEISNIQPLCRSCNSRKRTNTTDYRSK